MKRHLISKLVKWKTAKDRKPLVLKGARQVGKTYLLETFGKKYFKQYHIINFEKDDDICRVFDPDLNPERIIQELCFKLDTSIDIRNDLLIFDEIQNCPRYLRKNISRLIGQS